MNMKERCLCGEPMSETKHEDILHKHMIKMLDMGYVDNFQLKELDNSDAVQREHYSKLYRLQFIQAMKEQDFNSNNLCTGCNISLIATFFDKRNEPLYTDDTFDTMLTDFTVKQFGRAIRRKK